MPIPYRGKVALSVRVEEVDRKAEPPQAVAMSTHYVTNEVVGTRVAFAFITVLAVVLASGCAADQGATDPTESASDPSADRTAENLAPEAIDDPEEAAMAAYTRYWDTVEAAFANPDGDFTDFEAIASGQALEYAKSIEQRAIDEHVHGAGGPTQDLSIKETLLTDEVQQVVVIDCQDTTDWQVLDGNDVAVEGEAYGPKEIQARIEMLDGRWIVTIMAVQEIGTCAPDS